MGTLKAVKLTMQLLDYFEAEQLDVLLEPTVLLALLVEHGRDKDELKAALQSGTLPGDLLLELVKEKGAQTLWDSLSPRVRGGAPEKTPEPPPTKPASVKTVFKDVPMGWIVALAGSVGATMHIVGVLPEWGSGISLGAVVFAVVLGTAGGAWGARRTSTTAGAVGGLILALTSVGLAALLGPRLPPGRLVVIMIVGIATFVAFLAYELVRRRDTIDGF
ncbi:MAG: hypothetical protein AAGE52_40825 [Myxococcota bacterium]